MGKPGRSLRPFRQIFRSGEGSLPKATRIARLGNGRTAIKLIDGMAGLEQASTERNAAVKGVTQFRIMQFAGGKKSEVPWEVDRLNKEHD